MAKKGDTLIEVTLAIGIFSMIAIAIAAVMSGGTSGAQTALETTLAREEIDTQAEAIRFIHTAYTVDKDSADSRFSNLWREITQNAIANNLNDEILQYAPSSCSEILSNDVIKNHAFVINPRRLGTFTANDFKSVYIAYKEGSNSNLFVNPPSTYPHLIYGNATSQENEANLNNNSALSTNLWRAEGIYVIAVQDQRTTNVVEEGNEIETKSAFYDFYIRTCWYGTDANEPSTISTVIRLYDPDAITAIKPQQAIQLTFSGNNNNGGGRVNPIRAKPGDTITLPASNFKWNKGPNGGDNYDGKIWFVGWSTNPNSTPTEVKNNAPGTFRQGDKYVIPDDTSLNKEINLYAIWDASVTYKLDLNTFNDDNRTNTSGRVGFEADIIINGKKVGSDVIDYYKEVTLGSRIKIVLKKWPAGYHLTNFDTICRNIMGCSIREDGKSYVINLEIVPESLSQDYNSSNERAINIEPIWAKD